MKISIVISAHKESPHLVKAILSAKNQMFDDYEIILSSDGCNLKALAKEYGIKYCYSEKANHSTALNKAVKKAKGEYIKELHYDDILHHECLAELWKCAEVTKASIVYANAINFWPDGKKIIYKSPAVINKQSFYPPLKSPLHAATFLFKREDFLTVGGRDVTMQTSEEVDYYLNLLEHGYKFAYVDKVVVYYRRHDDQKSANFAKEHRERIRLYLLSKYWK